MTAEYSDWTPKQVDEKLAELLAREDQLEESAKRAERMVELAAKGYYKADPAAASLPRLKTQLAAVRAEMLSIHKEYKSRPWTRAYLVNNSNGHVHRSTHCNTCFVDTSYYWLTDLSGIDEAEIVDLAGERACTVCYPTAPVAVLSQPTRLFTPDEKAAQERRAERDAKRTQANAAQVVDPTTGKVLYKTERGCSNDTLQAMKSLLWYGEDHPTADEWLTLIERNVLALAVRQDRKLEDVKEELQAKAQKGHEKAVKESRAHAKMMGWDKESWYTPMH